jgi:hypothetical protein
MEARSMNGDPKEIKIPALLIDENKPTYITPLDIMSGKIVELEDGEQILITDNGRYSLNLSLDQMQELLPMPSIRISETSVVVIDKIMAYDKSSKEVVFHNGDRSLIEDKYLNSVEDKLRNSEIKMI